MLGRASREAGACSRRSSARRMGRHSLATRIIILAARQERRRSWRLWRPSRGWQGAARQIRARAAIHEDGHQGGDRPDRDEWCPRCPRRAWLLLRRRQRWLHIRGNRHRIGSESCAPPRISAVNPVLSNIKTAVAATFRSGAKKHAPRGASPSSRIDTTVATTCRL